MKKLAPILALALLIGAPVATVTFTGCAMFGGGSDPATAQRVQTAAKLASYVGTAEYLRGHPQTRPAFVLAAQQLAVLEAQEHVDLTTLLAIINQLPIKELKGERATVIVTAATILVSDYAGALPVEQLDELKPLAKAIREGIQLGLGTP